MERWETTGCLNCSWLSHWERESDAEGGKKVLKQHGRHVVRPCFACLRYIWMPWEYTVRYDRTAYGLYTESESIAAAAVSLVLAWMKLRKESNLIFAVTKAAIKVQNVLSLDFKISFCAFAIGCNVELSTNLTIHLNIFVWVRRINNNYFCQRQATIEW